MEMQAVKWTTEGTGKRRRFRDRKERRSEYSVTSGTRQLHRICWYPMRAFMELIQVDESRWHRGKCLPVLDSTKGVLSGTFLFVFFGFEETGKGKA